MKRVYIEITNVCNLECEFCPKNKRKPYYMEVSTFYYIIKQVKAYTRFIYFHVQGEPLLHPKFDEILDICDQEGMEVQIVTNGTLLKNHPNLLNHPSLRKISFSIQSIENQPDSLVDYKDYFARILDFCEKASQQERPFCELRFWRNEYQNQVKTKYCMEQLVNRYHFQVTKKKNCYRIMKHVYVDFNHEFNWPSLNGPFVGEHGTCLGAIDQIAILSNGNVVPCCLDKDGIVAFGNIRSVTLKEILSSGRYVKMVESLKKNRLREELCQHCTFRIRFDKNRVERGK